MAGYDHLATKMKRKAIDQVNDDFSDFSLSSPATKIRRLDLELPPIMEEEVVMEEHDPSPPENEERAIVLFKPPPHQHHQPHLFVDRSLISGLKNRFYHDVGVADEEDYKANKEQAVVPWNPSQYQFLESTGTTCQQPSEPKIVELDGDDTMMEEADMDVEEKDNSSSFTSGGGSVSLPQWQQPQQQQLHHCMIPPQLPQTNSTPISWFQ